MRRLWMTWARVWAAGLTVFGLALVGAADPASEGATRWVYGIVGPDHLLRFDGTLRFSIGLMGAVSAGWGVTTLLLALTAGCRDNPAVWRVVGYGFAIWFMIDSLVSIHTGFPLNAVSNVVLVATGAPALWNLGFAHFPSTNTAISTAGSVP